VLFWSYTVELIDLISPSEFAKSHATSILVRFFTEPTGSYVKTSEARKAFDARMGLIC